MKRNEVFDIGEAINQASDDLAFKKRLRQIILDLQRVKQDILDKHYADAYNKVISAEYFFKSDAALELVTNEILPHYEENF